MINELFQLQQNVIDDDESSFSQLHVGDVFNESGDAEIQKLHEYSEFNPTR